MRKPQITDHSESKEIVRSSLCCVNMPRKWLYQAVTAVCGAQKRPVVNRWASASNPANPALGHSTNRTPQTSAVHPTHCLSQSESGALITQSENRSVFVLFCFFLLLRHLPRGTRDHKETVVPTRLRVNNPNGENCFGSALYSNSDHMRRIIRERHLYESRQMLETFDVTVTRKKKQKNTYTHTHTHLLTHSLIHSYMPIFFYQINTDWLKQTVQSKNRRWNQNISNSRYTAAAKKYTTTRVLHP